MVSSIEEAHLIIDPCYSSKADIDMCKELAERFGVTNVYTHSIQGRQYGREEKQFKPVGRSKGD